MRPVPHPGKGDDLEVAIPAETWPGKAYDRAFITVSAT